VCVCVCVCVYVYVCVVGLLEPIPCNRNRQRGQD